MSRTQRRPVLRLAALAVVALVASACGSGPDLDVRRIAADAGVTAADLPPRDAELADTTWPVAAAFVVREAEAGRPVVMNLYGSWCEPCRAEAPLLRAAVAAHPDVTFLFVDTRDGRLVGERFLDDEGLGDQPSLFDPDGVVYDGLAARGMPTTAFFAADGTLVDVVHGILTEATLAQRIADLEATIPGGLAGTDGLVLPAARRR